MVRSENNPKRVTIIIDSDLDKKLRNKQARLIQETSERISFSRVLNDTLRKALK